MKKIQQEYWSKNQEESPRSKDTRNRLSLIILLSLGGNRGTAAVGERKACWLGGAWEGQTVLWQKQLLTKSNNFLNPFGTDYLEF